MEAVQRDNGAKQIEAVAAKDRGKRIPTDWEIRRQREVLERRAKPETARRTATSAGRARSAEQPLPACRAGAAAAARRRWATS